MNDKPQWMKDIDAASDAAKEHADALIDDEIKSLLAESRNWKELAPELASEEDYDRLIAIVDEATQNNMAIAEFRKRVSQLGKGAVALAKKLFDKIPPGLV